MTVFGGKATVFAGRMDSPDRVKVVETDSANVQYASGYLLFLRGATLMAQPFDEKQLAVTGSPVPVVDHVQRQGAIPPYRLFSTSQNGVLADQPGTDAATLAWVDRRGQMPGTIGEPANNRGVALSHDETRVITVIGEPHNLFIINLSNGVRTQFTFDGGLSRVVSRRPFHRLWCWHVRDNSQAIEWRWCERASPAR